MAYVYLVNSTCANRAAGLSLLWTYLGNAGWGLHDDQSGSSYQVWKSTGEASGRIPGYVKINYASANVIIFQPFGWWNSETHAGTCANTATVSLTTSESGFYLWIYGDKDLMYVVTKVSTTYYGVLFGHVASRQNTLITYLSGNASAGNNVTLVVASTTGFEAGNYQIFGNAGEGRDFINISSITDGGNMVAASLPRNYNANSQIGVCPSTFGLGSGANFFAVCPSTAVGTNSATQSGNITFTLYAAPGTDPDDRTGKYLLTPLMFASPASAAATAGVAGYHSSVLMYCPPTNMTVEDTLGVTQRDSGTAESGGNATLTDSNKTWSANEWENKVAVITFGTGVGQIRKIISNNNTVLTVGNNWVTQPALDSQYVICDAAYRYMLATIYSINMACKEGT